MEGLKDERVYQDSGNDHAWGTSKGVYLMASDLPDDPAARDQVILDIYGSPDVRQINGLGGADPLTSKVALIAPATRPGVDVDYTFGYVGIKDAVIDYEGNCGNISSGVGPFAILKGLVPGTGAKIVLNFLNSAGSKTGKLLPTGHVVDEITLKNGNTVRVSLVDAANPSVFVKAKDIGQTGRELPADTETNPVILELMEDIRTTAAVMMGLAASKDQTGSAVPKVAIVAVPQEYQTSSGEPIKAAEVDLLARTTAMAVMHKTYAVAGGICLATAALIEGTVVNEVAGSPG